MKEFDFGEYNKKLGSSARETLALAIEESRKRDHKYLSPYHLILALLRIEARFFEKLLAERGHSLKDLRQFTNQKLKESAEPDNATGLKVTLDVKSIFRLAWISSFENGRNKISSVDFIQASINDEKSPLIECLETFGVTAKSIIESLKPRLLDPVSRTMKSTQLSEDEKNAVKQAIEADDYWEAYKQLSSFYERVYETIEERRDQKRLRTKPLSVRQTPFLFRAVAILILLALIIFALMLAAEQLVGADNIRASFSLAACNWLTNIWPRECYSS